MKEKQERDAASDKAELEKHSAQVSRRLKNKTLNLRLTLTIYIA